MFRLLSKSAKRAEILIYGDIGPSYWGDGVSAADFAKTLRDAGDVDELDVRINSYGGDVFDGLTIYRQLADHKARVTVMVDGIAASAASVVAMAGDTIRIAEAGRMMIHDAWTFALGNADDMRATADRLDETSQAIAALYAARSGRGETELRDAMRAETWYTGKEAVEAKLADDVAPNKTAAEIAARAGGPIIALDPSKHKYRNTPRELLPKRAAASELILRQQAAIAISTVAARRRTASFKQGA